MRRKLVKSIRGLRWVVLALATCAFCAGLGCVGVFAQCEPDFEAMSTKAMRPLTTNPIEPGGTVEITIHVCNTGDDPLGPGCGNTMVVLHDFIGTHFYFENTRVISWDPNAWRSPYPGPPCPVSPDNNFVCITDIPGIFDPTNPATGGCTDVVVQADVVRTLPVDEVCNQAFVTGGLGPVLSWCIEPRGGTWGCTSPPGREGSKENTCINANRVLGLVGTKRVVRTTGGLDPDIFEAGDTISYELCLENKGNSILQLVHVEDYVPADQNDQPLFDPLDLNCIKNFAQTPDVGAVVGFVCVARPPFVEIFGETSSDFWLYPSGDPSGPNSVCFTYDVVTRSDLPPKTWVCNHAEAAWQGSTTTVLVPAGGGRVCEQIIDGPDFNGSTKTVGNRSPGVGTAVTFTIHLENKGNRPANRIRIEDQLDPGCFDLAAFDPATGLAFSPVPTTWTASMTGAGNDILRIDIDDQIAVGATLDIIFTVPLKAGSIGTCCNTAVISSRVLPEPEIDPTPTVDPDPQDPDPTLTCFDIGGGATLTATKTVVPSGDVAPGTNLTYTIRLENTGTTTATEVQIIDTLMGCLDCSTFVDNPASPVLTADCVSRVVMVEPGFTVPAGATRDVTFSIRVDAAAQPFPPCCNSSSIWYRRVPSDPLSLTDVQTGSVCKNVLEPPRTGFRFLKDVDLMTFPRHVLPGTAVPYVLTVENTGNQNAVVLITDALPACLDISALDPATSVTAAPGPLTAVRLNGRTLEIDLSLAAGVTQTIDIVDIVVDAAAPPGLCVNQAQLILGPDTWLSDDPADPAVDDPTEVGIIQLGFTKDVANLGYPRYALRGDPVVYELVIDNTSGIDAAARITDALAACLDISGLVPATSVTAVPGPLGNVRLMGRNLRIDLALTATVARQVITIADLAIDAAAPLGTTCDNQATLTAGGSIVQSNDPDEEPPSDDATDINVTDQRNDLRRQATTDACPLTRKPTDMAAIFNPRPSSVPGGPIPFEFAGDLLGTAGCLIFYESDVAARIAVVRGVTAPAADVRLEAY